MAKVMEGVKVVEVSLYGFVPAAGAVLADWGAEVIKIEHPLQGDPMRGVIASGMGPEQTGFTFMWDIVNRGKRSVGIDLATPEGLELLMELVDGADVFLTSFLPEARRRLGIDVDSVMARNPGIVYARGSGQGVRGPDAEKGGFDAITYWFRGGISSAITPVDSPYPFRMPGGAFGDVQSGMALAGGVGAGLAYRARTGEGTVVDTSLLAMSMWAMQPGIVGTALVDIDEMPKHDRTRPYNPLANAYRTADGRFLALNMLQADRYWPGFCEAVGRPDLIGHPDYATAELRLKNVEACVALLDEIFGAKPLAHWREVLSRQEGQWDVVQKVRELNDDAQALANGYVQTVDYGDGRAMPMVAAPVQFAETAPELRPAPEHGADTEAVLLEMGHGWDRISELKDKKVII
ncbi:MAG TPA: CoA transferase [Amycolatopsis sp.]|nr:CoA transferase [Amycolatopsis sp.]